MSQLLRKENISIVECVPSWEEAIRRGGASLVDGGYVSENYIAAIIENVKNHGPYIVISPKIALPHARPEHGVRESQFAIMLVKEPVSFNEEKNQVQLFITMAATDDTSYLGGLVAISELLQDEEKLAEIIRTESEDTLFDYFHTVNS